MVDIVYFAGIEFNDIKNKIVIDLGAGTGRISIASAFLNAAYIISIDIDPEALAILKQNSSRLHLERAILPICADIKQFTLSKSCYFRKGVITTIMNPPFGVQQRTADRAFLETAFSFSQIVYSIHLSHKGVKNFISRFIKKFGWEIDYIFPYQMVLEQTYSFHKKKRKIIDVDIYRFKKKD